MIIFKKEKKGKKMIGVLTQEYLSFLCVASWDGEMASWPVLEEDDESGSFLQDELGPGSENTRPVT